MRKLSFKGALIALWTLTLPAFAALPPGVPPGTTSDYTATQLNAISISKHSTVESMDAARIGCGCFEPNFFIAGLADFSRVSSTSQDTGTHSEIYGGIVGTNVRICDCFSLGGNFTYARTNNYLTGTGESKDDSYRFGLVASNRWDCGLHAEATVGGTWSEHRTHRATNTLVFPEEFVTGKTHGLAIDSAVQAGYHWCFDMPGLGPFKAGPLARFQYTNYRMNAYTEQGPNAMHFDRTTTNSYQSTLGFESDTHWCWGCWTIDMNSTLGWQHEFGRDSQLIEANFIGQAPLTLQGGQIGRDALIATKSISFRSSECCFVTLYNYWEFRRHYTTTNFTLRFTCLY